jgi:heme A synthase
LLLGGLLAHLAMRGWRQPGANAVVRYTPSVAFVLFLVQALVGAANIWTELQAWAAAAHLALAELLWAAMVTIATVSHLLRAPGTDRTPQTMSTLTGMSATSPVVKTS